MPASHRLGLWQYFLPVTVLLLASCAAPLGPVYSIKKQSLEVHYLAGDPPRLEIRARYQLKNTGNRNLAALEVGLPGEKNYGRKNLRAALDGGEIATSAFSKGAGKEDGARILFPRPWVQKEEHDLAIEYELTEPFAPYMGIAMAGDSLFLSSAGWHPVLRPPEVLLGKGGDRQKPLELGVRVPEGFLAHSSGRARGVRKENGELVYRFQITKEDFDPFLVAGRYNEKRFTNHEATIVFWTFEEHSLQEPLEHVGPSLAAAVKAFESEYGPLSKKPQPYWIAEAHPRFPYRGLNALVLPDTSFPRGALHSGGLFSFEGGIAPDLIEWNLAGSWFQELARPRDEAKPILGWALAQYATRTAEAELQQNRPDNHERIGLAIKTFDAERLKSKEKTLLSFTENDPVEQPNVGFLKAGLLLDALEDRCGKENLRHALRHMVQSLRGSTYGYNDLRSALEQECHQDLGPTFREWLTETGIPADFRERYERKP